MVKGDVVYDFQQLACGSFVATVSFPALQMHPTSGFPAFKKAKAKQSAATEALAYFDPPEPPEPAEPRASERRKHNKKPLELGAVREPKENAVGAPARESGGDCAATGHKGRCRWELFFRSCLMFCSFSLKESWKGIERNQKDGA